jgi:two-component system, NtrC family, sensor kinase
LSILVIVLIFGSINAYLIWSKVQQSLERESEKRASFIAANLVQRITNPILFEDYMGVQILIDETVALDTAIEYIFLINQNGTIAAHSFDNEIPAYYLFSREQLIKEGVSLISIDKPIPHIIRDISEPILNGKLGYLKIGLSEESISAEVLSTLNNLWIMVIAFLVLGVLGALLFSYWITKPILEIQSVTDKLNLEELKIGNQKLVKTSRKFIFKHKLSIAIVDEIDTLIDKFNEMIIRLKEAYQNLEDTQKNLVQSEKLATIGTISSGLAHEINNPIAGVKNCLRRIEKDPENIVQNKKYFVMMNEAVGKIEDVIKTLLNFSRHQEYEFDEVDIISIIENVLLFIGYKLERNRITIVKNIEPGIPKIYGSVVHIEQVILNLMINAIDAIEEKNELSNNKIIIDVQKKKNGVITSIIDTGIGIPDNLISKITDPFFTTKPPGKGTGLGLTVISNIIDFHNGKLEVESKIGKGSTFIIILPTVN